MSDKNLNKLDSKQPTNSGQARKSSNHHSYSMPRNRAEHNGFRSNARKAYRNQTKNDRWTPKERNEPSSRMQPNNHLTSSAFDLKNLESVLIKQENDGDNDEEDAENFLVTHQQRLMEREGLTKSGNEISYASKDYHSNDFTNSNGIEETFSKRTSESCFICLEPFEFFALGKCNHREQCSLCCLRRRMLYGQTECPICRNPQDKVIISDDFRKSFENWIFSELLSAGDCANGVYLDDHSKRHFEHLSFMWKVYCPLCGSPSSFSIEGQHSLQKRSETGNMRTIGDLKRHLSTEHKLQFWYFFRSKKCTLNKS